MEDPVTTVDGYTYERKVIETWLNKSDISPMTGLALPSKVLVPNNALRELIKRFTKESHGFLRDSYE
jgi:hypothetical protein